MVVEEAVHAVRRDGKLATAVDTELLNRRAKSSTVWRIRRATQLSKAITTDLAAHEVTRETAGIDEFFRAVESLYQRVADLFRDRKA